MRIEPASRIEDPRNSLGFPKEQTAVHRVVMGVLHFTVPILFMDLEVHGLENLPASGPVVLAVNHLTSYDVVVSNLAVPQRPIFYMGKAELFRNPIFGWLFRNMLGFPVQRGRRDLWALGFALELLHDGQIVGIYPEGHRSDDGNLQRAKSGAARLAIAANCPIVPMALNGTPHLLRSLTRRARVTASLGAPIYPQQDERPASLTGRVMQSIADMLALDSAAPCPV